MKTKNLLKGIFFILFFAVILSELSLFSASKPVKKRGAKLTIVSGSLVNWKDVKKINFENMNVPRRLKPILNFSNPKKIVKNSTTADPVVQDTFGASKDLPGKGVLGMTSVNDFLGMNFSANGAGWPPDTCGDVGPTYFVQAVNTSIGIYNKSTGGLVSATTFDAFFPSSVGSPCDADNNGDPIVLYDRWNQRWFILDFAWFASQSGGSYFSIAASQTSDPTGQWWTYCLHADNTLMNDYPKCGVWHDGIYITANMFTFAGSFQNVKVWALKTPNLYNGTMVSQSVTDSNYYAWSLLPGNAGGVSAPPSSAPNYMYALDANEFGSPSTDALYVWKYDVDWNNSANTTWTGPTLISGVAAFTLTSTRVPQSGTSNTLDSLAGRLMYPANYMNFGTYEAVYLCHVCDTSSRRAMRWYEIRIAGGNSSIYQQGTYSPDATHRWMGSIGADKNGNIAMGYSASSSSIYPGIRFTGRKTSDTLGTMGQGEVTIEDGGGYQSTYTRWGDYSQISLDPVDNETFWYTQEYYTSNGTIWRTRIGAFSISGYYNTTAPSDLENLVPVMTANNLPSGVANASSTYSSSYPAWKALDGNDESEAGSRWISQYVSGFTTPQWISYQFSYPKYITGYYILPEYYSSTKNRTPKDWKLEGWNGSSWVTLDSRTNFQLDIEWNSAGLYFIVPNPGIYSNYRLYVTAVNGSDVVSIRRWKMYSLGEVPIMTSDTTPSGTASASSIYDSTYPAWKAFDGNDESEAWSRWISVYDYGFTTPQWLSYEFTSPRRIDLYYILPEYGSSTKDRSPKNWTLEGWNGSTWVTLDTRTNILNDSVWNAGGLHFSVTNPGYYTKYRLYVTAVNGSDVVSIRQFKLFL
ncbi:MAG: discoidin domain-containing protein [Acidobacteria bacterium]|jgi:hypothetical protein|nr:discoidin domain-containing protein [Acidobacteriota bacterium]